MATLALGGELPEPVDLLAGKPFQEAGITGVVESDFFDWVLAAPESSRILHQISAQVARFRLQDIKHDVLKVLYESLIDPEQRHYLGEYYTPDWLAQWTCERVIDKPLEQRVLDPSCGSGTFLFHAVRRFLSTASSAGINNREALRRCTESIFGIDVHPVAVINARVTYLLAMGEERLRDHPSLSIPVYLGDSLQWYTEAILTGQTVTIRVPARDEEEKRDPSKIPNLTFPIRIASNPALFDAVVNQMLRLSEESAPLASLESWIEREVRDQIPPELLNTLASTYENLRKLRRQGRNHIWGYVARNLSRPVWLASLGEKVDVLIGNPPWLSYRYMSSEMQERFRDECQRRGLWAGAKVATHQDLSAYFFARCVELYLRKDGTVALVMPYATMTRQQYRGFRTGVFGHGSVRFADAWTFDESVQPLFAVPSCVLFAKESDAGSLPATVTAYSGQLPRRDASAAEAAENLKSKQVPWPSGNESSDSGYSAGFRQGATVVPRFLFLVDRVPAGRLGSNPDEPVVRSHRSNLEKRPWRELEPLQGPVEREFLRPLYLGESVAPFRLLPPIEAVIPLEAETDSLLDAIAAQRAGYQLLSEWLKRAEQCWLEYGTSKITLGERLNKFHGLTMQMPAAALRVVYSASGTIPAAAVLTDSRAVVEHKLYWAPIEEKNEAHYLLAMLNSEFVRTLVAPRQSRGQWGARDFDKLLAEAIPPFDPSNSTHCELASRAEHAESVAAEVALPENIHFIRARKMIRKALSEDGVAGQIEKLVAHLFGHGAA
jgi:hypothetical protein